MSAALKSYVPRPVPQGSGAADGSARERRRSQRLSASRVVPTAPSTNVRQVPLRSPSPLVKLLSQVQVVSAVMAGALVSLALVGYGTSVYVDRQLTQSTRRLHPLQRQSEQLTTAQEVLKNHLAQQVEAGANGLQRPRPDHVIFLQPSPQRGQPPLPTATPERFIWPQVDAPLGY